MEKMLNLVKCFSKKEEGAGSVEYGLVVALIAAVIVGSVTYMGGSVKNTFNSVATTFNGNGGSQPPAGEQDDDDDDHDHHH